MEVDDIDPAPLENLFLDLPDRVEKNMGYVLLGDPGIGKTAFLYVLLVLRLQARLPTIYLSRPSYLYYFANNGVYLFNLTPYPIAGTFESWFHKSTWCLIDSNWSLDTVPGPILDLNLFIVQASSPRPHRYTWIDKVGRQVSWYFMKPWTPHELLVGRYSTSAHSVYTYASDPMEYEIPLLEKVTKITYEDMAKFFREASPLDLAGPISHQIVSISPGATRSSFQSTFLTHYIYEKCWDSLSACKLEAVAHLYDIFVQNPNTRVPTGFMLEDAVNDVFSRGGEWSLVPLMKSNRVGPKYTHWKGPNGPITPQYLHLGYLGHHIAIDTTLHPVGTVYTALPLKRFLPGGLLQLVDGYYYPSSHSQETFDAFIYESGSKTATILQVTTAKSHFVKEGGVKWLQGLGVERFRYIAVSTPNTPIDLSFPNGWNSPTGPSIPEKYLLTLDALPTNICMSVEILLGYFWECHGPDLDTAYQMQDFCYLEGVNRNIHICIAYFTPMIMAHSLEVTLDFSQPNSLSSPSIPSIQQISPFAAHNDTLDNFDPPRPSELATPTASHLPTVPSPADHILIHNPPPTEASKPKPAGSRRVTPFSAQELFQLAQSAITIRFFEAGHGEKGAKEKALDPEKAPQAISDVIENSAMYRDRIGAPLDQLVSMKEGFEGKTEAEKEKHRQKIAAEREGGEAIWLASLIRSRKKSHKAPSSKLSNAPEAAELHADHPAVPTPLVGPLLTHAQILPSTSTGPEVLRASPKSHALSPGVVNTLYDDTNDKENIPIVQYCSRNKHIADDSDSKNDTQTIKWTTKRVRCMHSQESPPSLKKVVVTIEKAQRETKEFQSSLLDEIKKSNAT
ncbi:hypothetical protein AX17_004213 [Amanita inopinata Kibby_2008]|nr:hypothetical protein AX17_004213 [Amanita inopinata Kibby_2008]